MLDFCYKIFESAVVLSWSVDFSESADFSFTREYVERIGKSTEMKK